MHRNKYTYKTGSEVSMMWNHIQRERPPSFPQTLVPAPVRMWPILSCALPPSIAWLDWYQSHLLPWWTGECDFFRDLQVFTLWQIKKEMSVSPYAKKQNQSDALTLPSDWDNRRKTRGPGGIRLYPHPDISDSCSLMLTHLQKVPSITYIWHPPLVWVNCHWSWTPCLRHQVSYITKNIYFQIFVPNSSTLTDASCCTLNSCGYHLISFQL